MGFLRHCPVFTPRTRSDWDGGLLRLPLSPRGKWRYSNLTPESATSAFQREISVSWNFCIAAGPEKETE